MDVVCRPGTALVATTVIVATSVRAWRAIRATPVDPPATPSAGAAPLLGPQVRRWYRDLMAPIEAALADAGVAPDALTWAQLGVSVLAGWAFTSAAVFLGGWLVILAGTLDVLDGGLARRRGVAGPRGALVDSVVDRWAEFATFVGLGALFRDSPTLLGVALAAFASQMVSYARARAEGLGVAMADGRAQRPERYVLLGLGAVVSGLATHLANGALGGRPHAVLATVVWVLAGVATWTAVGRTRRALRTLAERG